MPMLYFHAGLWNYAVIGTFIKNEHAQGFLVKYGDTRVFFRLPFETMDLLWYEQTQNIPITEISKELDLTLDQVQRAFTDFTRKQRTTDC